MSIRAIVAVVAASLVAGCSVIGMARLEPGKSTEADVRQALGAPAREFRDPDGTRQLVFPTGPMGSETYMAYLAPDGRLVRFEQVLTAEHIRRIETGVTTSAQLERLLGPPWRTVDFPNLGQVAWDYLLMDTWGYQVDFSVMVDRKGIVAGTAYVRRDRGNDSGMK
jgi:outer membrane protein assembly factor BamE (lipoprotein component of BamABCDE complex)